MYDALVELIITGELEPGRHLVEKELAEQLQVSRQPVREALQRLQSEGWVELRPAQGAFVHVPTDEEAEQLLAVRSLLETESARLAAENPTPEDVEHLRTLWREGHEALERDDVEPVVALNASFHAHVTHMSRNQVLAELIALVDRRVRWYYTPVARFRGRKSWNEHAELIDAIAAGDGEWASRVMRKHTDQTRVAYRERTTDERSVS